MFILSLLCKATCHLQPFSVVKTSGLAKQVLLYLLYYCSFFEVRIILYPLQGEYREGLYYAVSCDSGCSQFMPSCSIFPQQ